MDRICSIGDFYPYAADYQYVSFDLFDTILKRRFLRVDEVHDTVSVYTHKLIGKRITHAAAEITSSRWAACSALKARTDIEIQEPTAAMVWDRLLSFEHAIDDEGRRSQLAKKIVDFEHALELRNLALVDGALELLQRLKAENKVIIAISDMYFGSEIIEGILEKLGVLQYFDHVYVSAEVNLTKQSGDLFRRVLDDLVIHPHQMRHVGDNHHSDVVQATEVGIPCVLCEQEHLLQLERPAYGKREQVEEDVADIVKAHLFSVLFDVQERQASHIYFMGRDGCTISQFLSNWHSDLVQRFLPAPAHTDIFLNRVLTCWADVDFSRPNWLEQAVGIAFWLKEGKASPADLSALLGSSVIPEALGTRLLVAAHDTNLAVRAYREAGLELQIKAAILAKCSRVEQYLNSEGFFSHKAVVVSDVGYSGTVPRALNRLLLNRSPEACAQRVPPLATLHLIATYSNYEINRVQALPTVQFSDRAVLPFERLPKGLRETFAWLEYFFKHPTLRPVLELAETAGTVAPLLIEDKEPADPIPSQRLQYFAIDRDEDIALIWMAATGNFSPLTDGILERFEKPDAATVAQMRDEIFELDPVTGTRRSVVLEIAGAGSALVAKTAIADDYWVPGSVVASAEAGQSVTYSDQRTAKSLPRHLRRWLKRSIEAVEHKSVTIRGFDPTFYRSFYPDLRQFTTNAELLRHYVKHGRSEGRLTSMASLRAQLRAEFGIVPEDFSADAYLHYNPELAETLDTPERALDHYMRAGRHEGRRYVPHLDQLSEEFEELRCRAVISLTAQEQRRLAAGESTLTVFLQRHRLEPGPWIDQLEVADFQAMHSAWCGAVSTRADCIVAICERGLHRAPSLSLRHQFDADYYRARIGEDEEASPESLYRHYLNVGSRRSLAPSEATELLRLWGNGAFPGCFDWASYRAAANPALAGASRVEVLQAFADDLTTDRLRFILRDNSAQFTGWLALRSWQQQSNFDEARRLLNAALDRGGNSGLLLQWLGDLELAAGRSGVALNHYRASSQAPSPNRWSFINAASMLLDRGDYKSALVILEAGRSLWQESVPWRRVHDRAMYDWSRAYVARRCLGSGSLSEADKLVREIARRVPVPITLSPSDGSVLVFTGRPHASALRAHVSSSNVTVLDLGAIERGEYLAAMLRHGTVIFHELPFTHHVLQSCLTARSLGKRTVSWLGDLQRWNDWPLDECIWDETGQTRSSLTRDNLCSEYGLLARYCEKAVSTIPGCIDALKDLVPGTALYDLSQALLGLRRKASGMRVALVLMDDAEARLLDIDQRAQELLQCVQADERLHLIVSPALASSRPFRDMIGRWSVLDDVSSLPDLADLIATTDLVVHFVDCNRPRSFATWKCAERIGVPAIVVPLQQRRKDGLGRASWAEDTPLIEGNLRDAIRSNLERSPLTACGTRGGLPELSTLSPRRFCAARKRILLVNTWGPPQVIGGASRVFKDNLDYLLDHHGDEFEIGIFAGDDYREGHGNFTLDAYRDVPVFRMALPPGHDTFWQSESSLAAATFASVLESFRPDLVHIHCPQRLTASIAESCQSRGVPYITTLHDAWWLSDYQFVASNDGLAAPAYPDYHQQRRNPAHGITASTLRAERLRRALLAAQRRLAVSQSFADLYESIGIPCDVVENGSSKIATRPRVPSSGPIQICHLGGLERHKGAFLVEAALRSGAFKNIEFTMVDLTQDRSLTLQDVWGSTPVNIVGKLDTAELSQLYSRMHILVAPSIWPESFGLVVREALAHGLWVIAGDRGALSEPVREGVNGHVVDVSNAEDLSRVFASINSNPERYRTSPSAETKHRSVDDQSRELVELYRQATSGASVRPVAQTGQC